MNISCSPRYRTATLLMTGVGAAPRHSDPRFGTSSEFQLDLTSRSIHLELIAKVSLFFRYLLHLNFAVGTIFSLSICAGSAGLYHFSSNQVRFDPDVAPSSLPEALDQSIATSDCSMLIEYFDPMAAK